MSDGALVFDRHALRRRRDRTAATLAEHDFLLSEVADRLADRLADINRRFPVALDLGCHDGQLGKALDERGGVKRLVQADLSRKMLEHAKGLRLVADEEVLPFAPASFDLVTSLLSLHWVNDLPGALIQIREALRPDGLFLAATLGGETLWELRQALARAELDEEGGVSPRVSPFVDVRDAGMLLQRAGFALPVVDIDRIRITYADALTLMRELRGMGETNVMGERRKGFTRRSTLFAAAAAYRDQFADTAGRVPATFEVLYLTGWAPHESQQKAARRGSGQVGLAAALGADKPGR
ncbi:MAG: methyltransferase domain-containing protein [Alphaproteobacteria bacterium]